MFNSSISPQKTHISRKEIKSLLSLAVSDRERELLRYTIYKTSGLTPSGARQHFGFQKMNERSQRVEECIEEAYRIREAIDKLSRFEDKAILTAMGINVVSESDSESESESESEYAVAGVSTSQCKESLLHSCSITSFIPSPEPTAQSHQLNTIADDLALPEFHSLQRELEQGHYNWFF